MKSKVKAMLFIFLFLVIGMQGIKAEEATGQTKIETNYTDEDKYKLELRVKEGGVAIDGNTVIDTGIVEYEMPLETKKVFEIKSKPGYEIKDIKYEYPEVGMSKSIIKELKNNKITLQTVSTKVVVTIEFEKSKVSKPNDNQKSNIKSDDTKTGDNKKGNSKSGKVKNGYSKLGEIENANEIHPAIWIVPIIVIFFILILLIKKKKEKTEEE